MIKIQAIMPMRNEDDIVFWTVAKLISQGIDVLVLDNHSTDSGVADVINAGARVERWGSPSYFSEAEKNDTVLNAIRASDADWIIYHDADEVFRSPVAGESYRAFVERVAASGATAINHTSRQYSPVDDNFERGDPESYFKHWVTEESLGFHGFRQERTFKRHPEVSTATCLHTIDFPGKILASEEGIRKHYPIRSQRHGMKKVFTERYGRSVDNTFTQYRRYLTAPNFLYDLADPRLQHD